MCHPSPYLRYTHTRHQSFYAGRPPNVSLDWIDAPYPDDEFPEKNDEGELEMSCKCYSVFRCRLCKNCSQQGALGPGGSRDCCMKYWSLHLVRQSRHTARSWNLIGRFVIFRFLPIYRFGVQVTLDPDLKLSCSSSSFSP